MAEAPPRPRALVLVGWGLALGLLLLLWRWPDRILALRHGGQAIEQLQGCNLAAGPCTLTLPDGLRVSLDATPRGLTPATPLTWTVALSDPAVRATRIELTGLSMPMGLTLVPLQPSGEGRAEGRGGLPACTAARMQWRAELTLEKADQARRVAFDFWAERDRDIPQPGPTLGWDGASSPTHGDLHLQTSQGPLSLSDLRDSSPQGSAVVVYFGYTSCPDICPTTLATVGAAFRLLDPTQQARVAGLFVSLDPDRDDLERLTAYGHGFHPAIRGGTAPRPQLEAMAADWGVSWRQVPLPGSGLAYAIDHSTDAWLVAPDGSFAGAIPHGTTPQALAEHLAEVLSPPSPGR